MIRTLGGIVAGMAVAITLIMIAEAIGNQVAPLRIDVIDGVAQPPIAALLFPILGAFLGALVGGFVAIRISDQPKTAWAVAGAVLAASIFNFILMAYPVWVMIAGLILPVLGGWLAQRICAARTRSASE